MSTPAGVTKAAILAAVMVAVMVALVAVPLPAAPAAIPTAAIPTWPREARPKQAGWKEAGPRQARAGVVALRQAWAGEAGPRQAVAAPAADSAWRWPLDGRPQVLRRFEPPPRPWLAGHRGVDLAATPGQHVVAAGAGVVTFAGELAGRGVVVIAHPGGLRTTYLPVSPAVRRGRTVSPGQEIGAIEDWPGHCAMSCLHWGLRRGDIYLDPLRLLGFGMVRLLPTWPAHPVTSLLAWPATPRPPSSGRQ
jgi:murein DD-endopeptidase MepM/ murein hydrolase activator NlpD